MRVRTTEAKTREIKAGVYSMNLRDLNSNRKKTSEISNNAYSCPLIFPAKGKNKTRSAKRRSERSDVSTRPQVVYGYYSIPKRIPSSFKKRVLCTLKKKEIMLSGK